MFSLMSGMFAWGALAASVPIILHLIQTSRTSQIPFSTLRFLKLAEKKSSRRIKLEHFILLLLRVLIMCLLAFGFAMPMVKTKDFGSIFRNAARDVAIVIDTSYSMGYNTGKMNIWDKATDVVKTIIEGLEDRDEFCIYLAGDKVDPLIEQLSGDKESALGMVKGLELGRTTSQLCPAVMEANTALLAEDRGRDREIFIITDNQALAWDSFGRGDGEDKEGKKDKKPKKKEEDSEEGEEEEKESISMYWDPTKITDNTTTFVVLLGVPAPENAMPVDVELKPELIMVDQPAKAVVEMGHSGPPQSTTVTLYVDDDEVAKKAVVIGGGSHEEISLGVPPLKAGNHVGRIEIPEDNLSIDNDFHFLLKVKEELPTVCVGGKNDTFFISTALEAAMNAKDSKAKVKAKTVDTSKISDLRLSEYACIFLCNALPLSGQNILDMERYVSGGGLLVIFPGSRSSTADYQSLNFLPAIPVGIQGLPILKRKAMLRWNTPMHPLFKELKTGSAAPMFTMRKHITWDKMKDGTEVLITSGAEHPFLLENSFGRGRVLLFAVPCDRTWSDFALSPYYLPLIHQIIQYAAGMGGYQHYIWSTEILPLNEYLPEATHDSTIQDPKGKDISIRTANVGGKTVYQAEGLMDPGIYTLKRPGDAMASPSLAVNIKRKESNLTPIEQADIKQLLGLKKLNISTDKEDLLAQIEDHRIGKTFGEQLLWLALLFAILEFFYSGWLLKKPPKLTDELGIEASGKVTDEEGHSFVHSEGEE